MVMWFLFFLTFLLIGLSGSTPIVSLSSQPHSIYGENLTLTCLVDQDVGLGYVQFRRDGSNILRITDTCTYLKDNSLDTYTYSVTCNLPQRIFTMVRQRVNYSDHNTTWSCQIYSASGSNGTCVVTSNSCSSAPVRVSVEGPPFVHLSPESSEYNVTEGTKNFNITCVVTQAIPWPTPNSFSWLYQASVIQGQRSLSYIIPEVHRSNNGYYQCIATNPYGNGTSKKLNLDVQYAPIVSLVDSKEIEEGDTIAVTCDVSANPKPVIVWTKSSKNVSVSANLTISSINRSLEGNYTCTANNLLYPTGQSPVSKTASKTLKVTIIYGPGNTINLQPFHSVYEVAVNQRAADIMCNASCKPKCSYKWNKNGATITNTNTLSLGVVQRSSQGNYTCEAYNTILHNTTRRSRVSIYVRVKFEDASLAGLVVGGVLAAILFLTLLTITVFISKRRGCSHGNFIKPDAVSKQKENAGYDVKTHFPLSTIYQSSPRVGPDPIYANAIDDGVARNGEYDGLLVNRPKSSLYLQLTVVSDVTADISGNPNDRQSVGDEYDDLNVYINYQVQSDISQHPEIQTEGDYQLYANLQTTT